MSWQPRVFRSREDLHPEFRALGLLDPDPEDVAACRRAAPPAPGRSALLRTVASSRIFTRSASKNTTGYIGSSGRALPRRHLRDDRVGDRADQIRRDLDRVHLGEEALNLAHRHPARVERQDLVVEAGEAPLVLGDQPRLEGALAIARHLDRQRAIVGQDRLPARPIAMIGRVVRLGAARRIAQVVGQLAAERALDDRLLEAPDRGLELLVGDRPLANELVENLRRDRRQTARQASGVFRLRRIDTPHAMPHTRNS